MLLLFTALFKETGGYSGMVSKYSFYESNLAMYRQFQINNFENRQFYGKIWKRKCRKFDSGVNNPSTRYNKLRGVIHHY